MKNCIEARPGFARWLGRIIVLLGLVFGLGWVRAEASPRAIAGPVKPCPDSVSISDAEVSNISATSATLSWQTDSAATTCLSIDSSLFPAADSPVPAGKFRGVAYAPGLYLDHLSWVTNKVDVFDAIRADVQAAAKAFFNVLVLYPVGSDDSNPIHPYDQAVFDQAAVDDMTIAFRLEWYPDHFAWTRTDCDAVIDFYRPYLLYFNAHPNQLQYFLLNNPLDDTEINNPMPGIQKQRDYVAYCYAEIKKLAPLAHVYANSYFGWRDELPQAPLADLVDGISLAVYAQHEIGAPYDCRGTPTAGDPLSRLICKDQFDYYIERSIADNSGLSEWPKPLVMDATGFAPAASFEHPDQKNGVVADSAAKAQAIRALRRYLEAQPGLSGWSYFMLLDKPEAQWGLIDRRRIVEDTAAVTHQRMLTDLLPGQTYTIKLQAGDQSQEVDFTTPSLAEREDPFLSITQPGSGTKALYPQSPTTIAWKIQDFAWTGATLKLYRDTDDHGCDGVSISDLIAASAPGGEYQWTVPKVTGMFYVYGVLDDGVHAPICDYSPGQVVTYPEIMLVPRNVIDSGLNITLDGKLDESIWQTSFGVFARSPYDGSTASVSAVWDDQYLYLGFMVDDLYVEVADPDHPWDDDSVSALFFNGQMNCRAEVDGGGSGTCAHALALNPSTSLNDNENMDPGYTVEMRISWAELHTTPRQWKLVPADFLWVDHNLAPGEAFDSTHVKFTKLSWDEDGSVDTTGRAIILMKHRDIFLPMIRK